MQLGRYCTVDMYYVEQNFRKFLYISREVQYGTVPYRYRYGTGTGTVTYRTIHVQYDHRGTMSNRYLLLVYAPGAHGWFPSFTANGYNPPGF